MVLVALSLYSHVHVALVVCVADTSRENVYQLSEVEFVSVVVPSPLPENEMVRDCVTSFLDPLSDAVNVSVGIWETLGRFVPVSDAVGESKDVLVTEDSFVVDSVNEGETCVSSIVSENVDVFEENDVIVAVLLTVTDTVIVPVLVTVPELESAAVVVCVFVVDASLDGVRGDFERVKETSLVSVDDSVRESNVDVVNVAVMLNDSVPVNVL